MSDAREVVAKELSTILDNDRVRILLDEVLTIEKSVRGWCPDCKKQVQVSISDAKAVTSCLIDLMNQSWGTPRPSKEVAAIDPDRPLEDLSDDELERLVRAVRRIDQGASGVSGEDPAQEESTG